MFEDIIVDIGNTCFIQLNNRLRIAKRYCQRFKVMTQSLVGQIDAKRRLHSLKGSLIVLKFVTQNPSNTPVQFNAIIVIAGIGKADSQDIDEPGQILGIDVNGLQKFTK